MARRKQAVFAALGAGMALVLAAGCDNGPSAVAQGDAPARVTSGADDQAGRAGQDDRDRPADHRTGPALKVDGEPMWAATRRYTAREGAQRTFERNGEAFGAASVEAFVRTAHAFVTSPPAGVARIERANGDVLLYDAKRNIFAVANKDGLPKTMFKPDDGAAYWDEQKAREASRQTARAERRERAGDDEG